MPVTAVTEVTPKGKLSWNLPPIYQPIIYRPGQVLHVEITVTNPQDVDQLYCLTLGLYDPRTGGTLLVNNTPQEWYFKIDLEKKTFTLVETGGTVFKVPAGESLTISGDLTFTLTNCILGVLLMEWVDGAKFITGLFTSLRAPFIDIGAIIPPLMTIALLGVMIPMIEKAIERK